MTGIIGLIIFIILGTKASNKGYSFAYGCLGPIIGNGLSFAALIALILLDSILPGDAAYLLILLPIAYIFGLYVAFSKIENLPDLRGVQSMPCPLCESLQTESMGSDTLFCYACNASSYIAGEQPG